MTRRHKNQPFSEINVTPLVDVMLVLLVIFMVTSPMLVAGVKVDLPDSGSEVIKDEVEPLSITIDNTHSLYINDTKIEKDKLIPKLKAITKEKFETRIFVRGDKKITYGEVVDIISNINDAGFKKVALVTNYNPK